MLPRRLFFDDMLDDFKFDDKMKCDIYEKDNVYNVEVDVPGFNKEDISIEFNKGTLSIIAEHSAEDVDDSRKYLHRERKTYGKVQRSFYLGEIDEDKIKASFNNGILRIEAPKKNEEENKKYIDID
mgnify:CR=1 FL=1